MRVINILRKEYPQTKWRYDPHSLYQWRAKNGMKVKVCSSFAPRYEGDEDNFTTEYYLKDEKGDININRLFIFGLDGFLT